VSTEATLVLLLDHVPPVVASESSIVRPSQTTGVPAMGRGPDCMLMVFVMELLQPALSVTERETDCVPETENV
jgi:hypothetical protein